jgi:hypothetical protein
MEESNCKTGLKSGAVSKEVFEREIFMCKKLNNKKGGRCNWGECKSCGVIPLLYKLHKGELLEKKEEIERVKGDLFSDKD